MLLLIFLISIFLSHSCLSESHGKIRIRRVVNGHRAEKIPYQVSIELNDYHLCGGSIISKNLVLTAAHCLDIKYKSDYTVRAGTNRRQQGGQLIRVKDLLVHPKFNRKFFDNDIGVIVLESAFTFNTNVSAILLAEEKTKPQLGRRCIISGWGYESEGSGYLADYLMYGFVNILDLDLSKKNYGEFSDGMICAGHINDSIDACNRDSGGPLMQDNQLIGVISAGVGCGQIGLPGLYTNVSYYRKWIDTVTKTHI